MAKRMTNRDVLKMMAIAKKRLAENAAEVESAKASNDSSACQLTERQKARVTAWAMANRQSVGRALGFARLQLQVAEKARVVVAQMKAWEEEKALRAVLDQMQAETSEVGA